MSLDQWKRSEPLPCCTFVAAWVLERATGKPCGSIDAGVELGGLDWWSRANVYDGDAPWSAIEAACALLGGSPDFVVGVGPDQAAPPLTPGRVHIVQRWRKLDQGAEPGRQDDRVEKGSTGHTYLAFSKRGGRVTIQQSSISVGFRASAGTWSGSAGLDGYDVCVLTLPA